MNEFETNFYHDEKISPNVDKELDKINKLHPSEIIYYIPTIIPTWLVYSCKHYTNDYLFLEQNWQKLCSLWQTTPKEILIVDFLPKQSFENMRIIELICNKLTKFGYVIRSKTELTTCNTCKNAQVTENVSKFLTHLNIPKWSENCSLCK